jgi:PilZ domain
MAQEHEGGGESQIGRRSSARARLCLPAKLMFPDKTCACLLENLSSGGARLHVETPPRLGAGVFLQFAHLELFCTVVWTAGHRCGVNFDLPLEHDIIVALRDFAENYARITRADIQREAGLWVGGQGRSGFGD